MLANYFYNQTFRVYEAEKFGLHCAILLAIFRQALIESQAIGKNVTKIGEVEYFYIRYNPGKIEQMVPYISRNHINTAKSKLLTEKIICMAEENVKWLTIPTEFQLHLQALVETPVELPTAKKVTKKPLPFDELTKEQRDVGLALLSRFSKYMPGSAAFNAVQQQAMLELLREFKYEKTRDMITKAIELVESSDQFAPKAYSVKQLQEKWGKIEDYKKESESQRSLLQELR